MYKQEVLLAHTLADISEKVILDFFRKPLCVEDKTDASPVTIADKEAERLMREAIQKAFPTHGIVGEEFGKENETAEFVWVLDPIDGTKSFIAGLPLFGTLIALLHHGKPVLGLINQPYTKERWSGVKGEGAFFNGRAIQTKSCPCLSEAVLCSTAGVAMFDGKDKTAFEALSDKVKITRLSTDCYGYALLAMGCVDVVCEAKMNLYDYAALVPIISEAGGFISDWNGKDLFEEKSDGHILALGDKSLLPSVLKALDI